MLGHTASQYDCHLSERSPTVVLLNKKIRNIFGFFFELLSKTTLVLPTQYKLTYSAPLVTLPGFGDNLAGP